MASSTTDLSIDFSRATASAICSNSSLFALTAISAMSIAPVFWLIVVLGPCPLAAIRHGSAAHALARRFDQRVGQHELRLDDVGKGKADQHLVRAAFGIVDIEPHLAIGEAFEHSAEFLAPCQRRGQLDLGLMAGPILEVFRPDQRTINAGRGKLE